MKKLLIIMTLFVSSFFLFNGDAKAYSYSKEISFDYINDDFYAKKQELISFLEKNTTRSDYYVIYTTTSSTDLHALIFPLDRSGVGTCTFTSASFYCRISHSIIYYDFITHDASGGSSSLNLFISNENAYIIDTNVVFTVNSDSYNSTIDYTFGDFKLVNTANGVDKLYSLYDMYQEYQLFSTPVNPHQEEIDKLSSFYSMVLDKLSYLAEVIVSNYIYLSIIVIFIIIFIFKLIFRRYL